MPWKLDLKPLSVQVFADVQPGEIEQTVQAWLTARPTVQVLHVAQSQGATGLATLTLFYARH